MSDEDNLPAPMSTLVDRVVDGENHGVSLRDVKSAITEVGEARRRRTSGALDLEGEHTPTLRDETLRVTEPIAAEWRDRMLQKYPHVAGMTLEQAAAVDENFRRDITNDQRLYQTLQAGTRRALAQREHEKLRSLRPQAYNADGSVNTQFRDDAVAYLQEVKGLSREEAAEAYRFGALGKASQQAALFDQSNAWGRDRRELKALTAKRNLGDISLREATKLETLRKRLGKG
jgi:hypothetical protein